MFPWTGVIFDHVIQVGSLRAGMWFLMKFTWQNRGTAQFCGTNGPQHGMLCSLGVQKRVSEASKQLQLLNLIASDCSSRRKGTQFVRSCKCWNFHDGSAIFICKSNEKTTYYAQRVSHKLINWHNNCIFDKRKVIQSCCFQCLPETFPNNGFSLPHPSNALIGRQ